MSNLINQRILVSASQYDFSSDKRILIPFENFGKFGFANHNAEIIVEPIFNFVSGELLTETDQIIVGKMKHRIFPYGQNHKLYSKLAYGVMDATGRLILETDYARIIFSDDSQYITAQTYECTGFIVYSNKGDVVIAEKEYDWMDGFWKGFARVKRNGKFGIIDTKNQIILPIEYDNIWNFYGKPYDSIVVVRNGVSTKVSFSSLKPRCNFSQSPTYICDDEDDYGTHYGEYEGSYAQDVMGYSDDVINDAFEGDPDAYWNID